MARWVAPPPGAQREVSMFVRTVNRTRWNRIHVGVGVMLWLLLDLGAVRGIIALDTLTLLVVFALSVMTPLALPLIVRSTHQPLSRDMLRLALLLCPFAALVGGVSFVLSTGLLAGAAAGVWLLFTLFLAFAGVLRLRGREWPTLADVCLSLALIYLPIGGAWMVAARLGIRPLGFSPTIVLLTAIHFHYIPLAALVMTGLLGQVIQESPRARPRRLYLLAAVSMLISPAFVATGHIVTQLTGRRVVESCAALVQAISLILIALLTLRFLASAATPRLAQGLLAVSSVAVLATMLLATAYAVGAATGAWVITTPQMIAVHGVANALAFGFCGLLGWRLRSGWR
jgi:hypothetical protein